MGDTFPRLKGAVVQAAPVFLDRDATVAKACRFIEEAADLGAQVIVFPECYVPAYPHWFNFYAAEHPLIMRFYRELFKNSVVVPSPATDQIGQAAEKARAYVVIGINEKEANSYGTLYNTYLFFASDGELLGKHRKLVPTYHERMIWGHGDASTLNVFETEIGRLGGLVCWEHWMPLARYALYTQGEQIHAALWPTATDTFHIACRNMAFEGRLFVIVSGSYLTKSMLPADFELAKEIEGYPEVLSTGGSAIIGPDAKYLAGPVYDEETILYADIDLERIIEEKQALDVVGHYSRSEFLKLQINRSEMNPVSFAEDEPQT